MAKKKKNIQPQQMLSPEQFIKQKARNLPVEACYISKDIENVGEGTVIVVRRHPNEKFTLAIFLLDIFCLGVKDTFYRLRLDEFEYEEFFDKYTSMEVKEITYNEAHNWIYGAIAFAEEAGIAPHKDFNVTQYMLEEDTEDIPLIEYNYGKDGKHFLVAMSQLELSRYIPILKKNLGDDFDYVLQDDEDEYDDYEEVQDEDEEPIDLKQLMENFKNSPLFKKYGPDTEYTYQHPEYPMVLNVENKGLVSTLFDPTNFSGLSDEDTDRILAMPHDTLRRDLEQIILFHTGETCDGIPEDLWEADNGSPITHALFLLGEIGDEGSLDVVLETLRQSSEYSDFHFGDLMTEIYLPTLYKLGKDRLDKLMEFAKEKGLDTFNHVKIFPPVAYLAYLHPERRNEVIEWFREILRFATEKLPETQYFDSELAGMILSDLIDLKAEELLPEIKAMFDTGLVSLACCGDYEKVEKDILSLKQTHWYEYPMEIHERFAELRKRWKK